MTRRALLTATLGFARLESSATEIRPLRRCGSWLIITVLVLQLGCSSFVPPAPLPPPTEEIRARLGTVGIASGTGLTRVSIEPVRAERAPGPRRGQGWVHSSYSRASAEEEGWEGGAGQWWLSPRGSL